MALLDLEGARLMAQLMSVIVEDNDDYEDHILVDYCGPIYEVLLQSVQYLTAAGVEPPLEVLAFIGRFVWAANNPDTGH